MTYGQYPLCPHCRQRIINPGGHAEACTGPGPQLELDPQHRIDPTTQATRTPGLDAKCENGLTADTCRWPYCDCYVPDRY